MQIQVTKNEIYTAAKTINEINLANTLFQISKLEGVFDEEDFEDGKDTEEEADEERGELLSEPD